MEVLEHAAIITSMLLKQLENHRNNTENVYTFMSALNVLGVYVKQM